MVTFTIKRRQRGDLKELEESLNQLLYYDHRLNIKQNEIKSRSCEKNVTKKYGFEIDFRVD